MKYILSILFITTCIAKVSFAQENTTANLPLLTDRPSYTNSASIVHKGYWQVESSLLYEDLGTRNLTPLFEAKKFSVPTILIKYGINKNCELRLDVNSALKIDANNKEINSSGVEPLTLGVKVKLWDQKNYLPTASLISSVSLNKLYIGDYTTNSPAHNYILCLAHQYNKSNMLQSNIGLIFNGNNEVATLQYTLNNVHTFNSKLSCFTELYGFSNNPKDIDLRFDAGLIYLSKPNQQWDVNAGVGLMENSPTFYASLGYSFMVK